ARFQAYPPDHRSQVLQREPRGPCPLAPVNPARRPRIPSNVMTSQNPTFSNTNHLTASPRRGKEMPPQHMAPWRMDAEGGGRRVFRRINSRSEAAILSASWLIATLGGGMCTSLWAQ